MTAATNRRDNTLRLVAVAFVCGFAICACMVSFIPIPAPTQAIQTVPVIAATQFQWSAPDAIVVEPQDIRRIAPSADPSELLRRTRHPHNFDLIDLRFQPQIPLE